MNDVSVCSKIPFSGRTDDRLRPGYQGPIRGNDEVVLLPEIGQADTFVASAEEHGGVYGMLQHMYVAKKDLCAVHKIPRHVVCEMVSLQFTYLIYC